MVGPCVEVWLTGLFHLSQEWYPHYFVLTSSKIYYSEETSNDQGNEDEEEPKEVELFRGVGSV